MPVSEQIAFVMVRPKNAGNIGAAARALKNMGFTDLRLVAPDAGADRVASELAAHGRELLSHAARYDDLPAALHDRTLTIGTTCRGGPYRTTINPLRAAVSDLTRDAAGEQIAIIFGPEDHGLSNEDLKCCQRLILIPTAPEYPSINLAQAVMLTAWELFMARRTANADTAGASAAPALAPFTAVEAMLARMERALLDIGFLPADNPSHIMFALRAMLGRAGLEPREVDILDGISRQIGWFARGGRDIIEAKRQSGRKIR